MLLTPVFPAGLQRARRPLPGFGERPGAKPSFPLSRRLRRRAKEEKRVFGDTPTPAGRTLHPWFSELFQKFGMTHTPCEVP